MALVHLVKVGCTLKALRDITAVMDVYCYKSKRKLSLNKSCRLKYERFMYARIKWDEE